MLSFPRVVMSNLEKKTQPPLPYIPNELRIRILLHISVPHFLWTTCRFIAPEFKQWSEELYARDFLPKLKIDLSLELREPEKITHNNNPYLLTQCSYRFNFYKFENGQATRAIFIPNWEPASTVHPLSNGQALTRRRARLRTDRAYTYLQKLKESIVKLQVSPEIELGMRQHDHVCPCRSLKANTRRGVCRRSEGAERCLEWDSTSDRMAVDWKLFLAYVYRSCPAEIPRTRAA